MKRTLLAAACGLLLARPALAVAPMLAAPITAPAVPCASTVVGTTPTLILPPTAGDGIPYGRLGGGLKVPSGAAQGIYYSWLTATPTAAESGGTFFLAPGATLLFAGQPNTALTAIAAASTVVACSDE